MRYRARIDKNQPSIVKELRKLGFSVLCLHQLGKGVPDLLIGKDGRNYLIELKSSDKGKLTTDEAQFFQDWKGNAIVATSIEDIINLIYHLSTKQI